MVLLVRKLYSSGCGPAGTKRFLLRLGGSLAGRTVPDAVALERAPPASDVSCAFLLDALGVEAEGA